MKSLSFYEFTGIVLPGAITILGISVLFPDTKSILFSENLSVGDFGLVLIIAYAAGQIIQALGNFIEKIWWNMQGGVPCHWVRNKERRNIISKNQIEILMKLVAEELKIKNPDGATEEEWFFITRQMYVLLEKKNRTTRIDVFNGNYGLNRGLTASLALLSVLSFILNYPYVSLLLFVSSLITLYRMNRFAKYYARELFLQFLEL